MSVDMPAPDHRTLLTCDYVLLNPLQIPAESWKDLPTTPLIPKGYQAQPELFPRLLALNELNQSTRVDLLNRQMTWERSEDDPWFSALLFTPVDVGRLQRHLCRLMPMQLPDGSPGLLRHHDPRTSRHLAWLLNPEQRNQWLGPIERWCWRNPNRTWTQVERRAPATSPLRFTKEQLGTVLRIGEINLCLARLARTVPHLGMV